MDRKRLERVAVIGTSCAGKTTLARSLSRALGSPHIELDALHWGPNWTPQPLEVFAADVESAVAGPRWVIDGNYSKVRERVWRSATTLVWLNYPFTLVFSRALSRTLRRIVTQEPLFAGNRESLSLFDPEWIPWWVLRTYGSRRRSYPVLFRRPEFAHLQVLEFKQPREAQGFVEAASRRD